MSTPARRSVSRRLVTGLSLVGIVGATLLLILIVTQYHQIFLRLDDPQSLRDAAFQLTEHVVLPIVLLIAPMAAAGYMVIRQSLQPLEDAAEQIKAVEGHERGIKIDDSALPAEAMPFARAVNDLLERLDQAARDQEAFAADVAHELRTPLAVLSLELEAMDHPDAGRLKAELLAMRRLIDQLMLLAQIDAEKAAHVLAEPVPLAAVGADIISLLAPAAITDGKTIALEEVSPRLTVRGRREAIAAALRNLVENAVRVTPVDGVVTVLVGPGPSLRVRDGGPGVSVERLEELVRRHRRADNASKDGAGLGLAIVSRIMAAYGGTLKTVPDQRELVLDFSASR